MAKRPRITKQEREWMAEDDMRALARAEEIKADKTRLSLAKKAGKRLVKEKKKEATAMQKAVNNTARKKVKKKK